jgi:pimeloyl-ACP methyl ester carboxylesterase
VTHCCGGASAANEQGSGSAAGMRNRETFMAADYDTGFSEHHYRTNDGLKLYVRRYAATHGERTATPVVCLPGLTRNSRDFHQLALMLAEGRYGAARTVYAFDYRGRGRSEWASDKQSYNILTEADDVVAGCAALQIDRAVFIGTSRGGLILHVLAGLRPTLIAGTILNDIGPVIEAAGLAQIRSYLTRGARPKNWKEAADILKETHGGSFTTLTDADWQDMAHAIYAPRGRKIAADYDPAIARQLMEINFDQPLPALWPQFEGLKAFPIMVIRGANSTLLSAATLEEMQTRNPNARAITVEAQGHAPLLHLGGLPQQIAGFIGDIE